MRPRFNTAFGSAGLCAFLALAAAPAQLLAQGAQGTWKQAGQTTTQRSETGTAVSGGKVYLMGGEAMGRQDSPLVQEFDPAGGHWRDLAPMPKGASHVGVAAMNGKIYIAGGFTANVHKNPLDQFAEYDIAKNSWRDLPPLPTPLGSVGLAAIGGKLHVIGGRGPDGKTVGTHSVFDPASGKWTTAASLPVARDHLGIVVADGKIYIVGGRTNATIDNVGLTDAYDPATDKWQSLSPMPTPRSSGAIAYYKGLIVYHGGECKDATKRITFDEFEAFDPKANSWKALPKAPTGLHAQGGAAVGNSMYVLGGTAGCGGDNPSGAVYAFNMP
jgi:N-acetylneuraminic acid mutarotase